MYIVYATWGGSGPYRMGTPLFMNEIFAKLLYMYNHKKHTL